MRMGTGVEYDENIVNYLNNLFNALADAQIIKNKVKSY